MSVQDLIAQARAKSQTLKLPPAAVADLRKVLAANDRVGKFQRVTTAAFATYLATKYRVRVSTSGLVDYCKRELKRGWVK
jgi:hypothetical protein